jgi:hypothetical protein
MSRKPTYHSLALLSLITVLMLAGCAAPIQPVSTSGTPPTPVVTMEAGGVEKPTLQQALATGDSVTLQAWMTDPVLTGTWRGELAESSPAEAVKTLLAEQPGEGGQLSVVEGADLKALLGGKDPRSILGEEAGVTEAILVSGWGKEGRDEAILFTARQPDGSLKLRGWMVIQGGFSGARLGGNQPYANEAQGYSVFLPKGYGVTPQGEGQVAIFPQGEGHPGGAWIVVEAANGRSAEQVVEAVKAELGPGFNVSIGRVLDIEGARALVVNGLPGQDPNRQVFMVHDDRLYHITFAPDDPQMGEAYRQMEEVYAMIVNTFHFIE